MSANHETLTANRTRYGTANPEKIQSELWVRCIREGWGGYALRKHFEAKGGVTGPKGAICRDYVHSSYRDTEPGPFWSWERFGQTSTQLPDGRIIHIAGEHEDYYDPDFCIYNDVVVEYPDGRLEIYLYPKDIFPPTDFHTATLFGDHIILIGSVGYTDMRRVGETQVLKLNTRTLSIEPVITNGEGPGWISRHRAELLDDTHLLILGGKLETEKGYVRNGELFLLDLATMRWKRMAHGNKSIFPITEETYHAYKNPRYGGANPERTDNPFWCEMLHRKWPPSRARLHYGDLADPVSGKESWRNRNVVWTAIRFDALDISLPDGRHFLIGGSVEDYGSESTDSWTYNDVVVTYPDGVSEIFTYPLEVLPDMRALTGFYSNDAIYLFGISNWARDRDLPRGPHIYRLDTKSFEVSYVTSVPENLRVSLFKARFSEDGTIATMHVVRQKRDDPQLLVDLDVRNQSWSEPYPSGGG